jgi:hypothetical protein
VQKYHSGKEVLHLAPINPRCVTNGGGRAGMAAKAAVVCDLVTRRGRPSSPVLRFLGGELRIVRFRVRAVNSSKAWNKSLRAGFNLAGHISRVNVKQWHFSRSQFWGTAKRRLRDVRMRKLLHPQAPQNVGVHVIHITTGIRCIEL